MKWISVNDRLPDNEDYVLAVTKSKTGVANIVRAYYSPELERWASGMNSNVTYWMPMPELPKEELDETTFTR